MADTYNTDAPETVKIWSKELWREYRKADAIWDESNGFTGPDVTKNPIISVDDMQKTSGDEITIVLRLQGFGEGVVGDEVLEGKETSISTTTFKMKIDDQAMGWKSRGVMTGQRVNFDALAESRDMLSDQFKTRRAVTAANHLCGNTRQTNLHYLGSNLPQEPDSNHAYQVGAGLATLAEESLAPSNLFDLDTIDELVTSAEALSPPIRPMIYKGNPYYGLLIHPYVMADLRKSSSRWYQVMIDAVKGGRIDGNPLFTRAAGMWRNVLIFVEPHLVQGRNSSTGAAVANTRRNVFMGAGALALAYGRVERGTMDKFRWYNSTYDHGRKYYGSAGLVWGLKAPRFVVNGTSRDYGKIVVSSYSVDRKLYEIPGGNGTTTPDLGQVYTS